MSTWRNLTCQNLPGLSAFTSEAVTKSLGTCKPGDKAIRSTYIRTFTWSVHYVFCYCTVLCAWRLSVCIESVCVHWQWGNNAQCTCSLWWSASRSPLLTIQFSREACLSCLSSETLRVVTNGSLFTHTWIASHLNWLWPLGWHILHAGTPSRSIVRAALCISPVQ